jgi:hypothetical protein
LVLTPNPNPSHIKSRKSLSAKEKTTLQLFNIPSVQLQKKQGLPEFEECDLLKSQSDVAESPRR